MTFSAGNSPPTPGLAPWLSLISIAANRVLGADLDQPLEREPAVAIVAAEVSGPDLEDQFTALLMVPRESAFTGVLKTSGELDAGVEGLDRHAGEGAELIPETPTIEGGRNVAATACGAHDLRARHRVVRPVRNCRSRFRKGGVADDQVARIALKALSDPKPNVLSLRLADV